MIHFLFQKFLVGQCPTLQPVMTGSMAAYRVAFSLLVSTEMAILKGVVHVTDTPTSHG